MQVYARLVITTDETTLMSKNTVNKSSSRIPVFLKNRNVCSTVQKEEQKDTEKNKKRRKERNKKSKKKKEEKKTVSAKHGKKEKIIFFV